GRNKRELQALRRKHSTQVSKHVQHFHEPTVPFPVSFTRFGQHLQLQCKNHLPRRLSERLMPRNLGRSPSPRLQTIKRRVVKKSRAGRLRPFPLRRQSRRSLHRRDSGLVKEKKDPGSDFKPEGNDTVGSNQSKQSDVLPDLLNAFPHLQLNREVIDAAKDKPISRRDSYTPTRHPISPRNFQAVDQSTTVASKSANSPAHRFSATNQCTGHQSIGSEPTGGDSRHSPRSTTHTPLLSSSGPRPPLPSNQSVLAPSDRFLEDWVDIDQSQLEDIPEERYPRLRRPVTHSGSTLEPPLVVPELPYYHDARQGYTAHGRDSGSAPRATVNNNHLPQSSTQPDDPDPAQPSLPLPTTDDNQEKSSRSLIFGSHRRSLRAKKPMFKSPVVLHAQGYFDDMVIDRNTLTRNTRALRVVTSPRPVSLGQDDNGNDDTQQLLNRLLRRGESLRSVMSDDSSLCLGTIKDSHDRQVGGLCTTAPAFWCSSKMPFKKPKKKSDNDDCHVM
ncbi:hypothetical protein IWQ62_001561, partial [Dispira parvispora]